jgi:triosephosphate isomerase (TIM)
MRKPWIVGNWKMNTTRGEAQALAHAAVSLAAEVGDAVEIGLAPPAIWLTEVVGICAGSPVKVFAQNIGFLPSGALTGEISVAMLTEVGVNGTLVGHSERREHFGDTDVLVGKRRELARTAGLLQILCVGETLAQRDADETTSVVLGQLNGALAADADLTGLTIAYEPVWAIGTGRTATPEQAQEVHASIRGWLNQTFGSAADHVRIQYGGSVKGSNAAELLGQPDIDGALVGGASLLVDDFARIIRAALG